MTGRENEKALLCTEAIFSRNTVWKKGLHSGGGGGHDTRGLYTVGVEILEFSFYYDKHVSGSESLNVSRLWMPFMPPTLT
jgi:hypothetical protein